MSVLRIENLDKKYKKKGLPLLPGFIFNEIILIITQTALLPLSNDSV
jgi:hypothetical protein